EHKTLSVSWSHYRSTVHKCTFVFSPQVIKQRQFSGPHYKVDSIRESWTSILKRAGLRHRKSYQSRHTYACWSLAAGANPSFIASQMGHTNAQMVFNVYGAWMKDNNHEQIELLNRR
ncbi:tyrosine-type recombinase/integrase, partial [Shigella flexneri]